MENIDQLNERAEELGILPEIHFPEGLIFLRNVPDSAWQDPAFHPLVNDCLENNTAAMDALRTKL